MIDLSMYARRIGIVLKRRPPNFPSCRLILSEAEEAWNNDVGGVELSDSEKLAMPIAETGMTTRLVNAIEEAHGFIYVKDMVGMTHNHMLVLPFLNESGLAELRKVLGPGFCDRYGIAWTPKEVEE